MIFQTQGEQKLQKHNSKYCWDDWGRAIKMSNLLWQVGLICEMHNSKYFWDDWGRAIKMSNPLWQAGLISEMHNSGFSSREVQSHVKTLWTGSGNDRLQCCAIVHFWGGQREHFEHYSQILAGMFLHISVQKHLSTGGLRNKRGMGEK